MKQWKETLYGLKRTEGNLILTGHDNRPLTWTSICEAKKASTPLWKVVKITKITSYKIG